MQRLKMTLFAFVAVAPMGCGGDPAPPPAPPSAPVATTLVLSPSPLYVGENQIRRMSATVLDQTGAKMEVPVLWNSADPMIMTVSDSGAVRGVRKGTALLWARGPFQVQTVLVTVVDPFVVEITGGEPAPAVQTTGSPATCVFTLKAVASGGAPGDSATFAPSAIDLLDEAGAVTTIEVDSVQMLDRFGRLVIRSGQTLETHPLRVTPGPGSTIVNRVRYKVGEELRSARVPITCPPPTS